MGRKKSFVPANNKENAKRTDSKMRRGFGRGMISKLGISDIEWCQRLDPLFEIKGIERHLKLKG